MKKKMTSKENILPDVLDYLKGKASDDQTRNLQEWLADSDENKEQYREIVRTYYRAWQYSELGSGKCIYSETKN